MDFSASIWWIWVVVGIILLALELLTPGTFFLMFFGASAIIVGLLSSFGVAGPPWVQFLLFAALSVVSLVSLRRLLVVRLQAGDASARVDTMVGETAIATQNIAIDDFGRVELRGAVWNARNIGNTSVLSGDRCTVERVDNLTLWISHT